MTLDSIIEKEVNDYINKLDEEDIPIYKINNKKNLVLSGGGILGIAHIGAINALEECGMMKQIDTIICTSVGAIMGGLYIAGYDSKSLYKIAQNTDFSKYKNLDFLNLFDNYGLDSGKNVEYWLKRLIKNKGFDENINLSDFFEKTKKKLVVTSVSLEDNKTKYISYENYPDLELYKAIRMSISIPIIYMPVRYNNNLYVDGGCRDNFPMQYVKDELDETIGIYISNDAAQESISSLDEYISATIKCIKSGMDYFILNMYKEHTININIEDVNSTDFALNITKKKKLYDEGYRITKKKLSLY